MKTQTKKYSAKHVDMIIAASTIMEAAIENKALLQSKRSAWADPFFDKLKTRIDKAAQDILGIDNAKQLREATHAVAAIQKNALDDLSEAKVQIAEDFKKTPARRDEILRQLGFSDYYGSARKANQEALIQLLFRFKDNLTEPMRLEIEAAGTDAAVLARIKTYVATLKKAEVSQENLKGKRKVVTAANAQKLNDIYEEAISICRIAARFLKDQPALKAQFSFRKIVKNLSSHPKAGKTDEPQIPQS